jgi:branched-chain amino acid transport system permease protein
MLGTAKGAIPVIVGIALLFLIQATGASAAFGQYHEDAIIFIGINLVMGLSLNIVNGYTGQFSIGHAGFMALGAYAGGGICYYGALRIWGGVDLPPGGGDALFVGALVAAGLVAALFGYIVGLPSLRLRGDYLAIVTLGFAEIIRILITQTQPILRTPEEARAHSPLGLIKYLGGKSIFDNIPRVTNFFWTYSVVLIVFVVCYRLKRSTHGRAMLAVRENEIAAEAMGVDTTRYKVRAFVLSSFFAGVAGALHALKIGTLDANRFDFQRSFEAIVMVVLGGMGSITGVCVAAVFVTYTPFFLRDHHLDEYRMVIYSIGLVLLMILRPQGLFGTHEIWDVRWSTVTAWLRGLPTRMKLRLRAVADYARKVIGVAGSQG